VRVKCKQTHGETRVEREKNTCVSGYARVAVRVQPVSRERTPEDPTRTKKTHNEEAVRRNVHDLEHAFPLLPLVAVENLRVEHHQ
jgi:hypothetical protein